MCDPHGILLSLWDMHIQNLTKVCGIPPDGPSATPDTVASLVSYLVKPEAYFITGKLRNLRWLRRRTDSPFRNRAKYHHGWRRVLRLTNVIIVCAQQSSVHILCPHTTTVLRPRYAAQLR